MLSPALHARVLAVLLLLAAGTSPAAAQGADPDHQPIGWFAGDARGVSTTLPHDPGLATFLGVTPQNLPTRGLGIVFGGHVYPLRLGRYVAFGLGGELMFGRGSTTLPTEEGAQGASTATPTVSGRLSAVSPQFSLNFGGRDGWSFLSGGIGWTTFSSSVKGRTSLTAPDESEGPRAGTINYGGGARWFMKKHLAFSLDLRFYAIRPQEGSATRPTLKRQRLVTLSAGVSVK